MQRRYAQPGPPGRKLFDLIAKLGPADKLTVEHSAMFGSNPMIRAAFLQAILARGIRLHVVNIAKEHADELCEHHNAARKARYSRAVERGAYENCGRPQSINRGPIIKLLNRGLNAAEVSRQLSVPTSTVYRVRDELRRAA
jgi:hypothetical protein